MGDHKVYKYDTCSNKFFNSLRLYMKLQIYRTYTINQLILMN